MDAKQRKTEKPDYLGHRQRLKERFLSHGLDGLHDYEVLELLLSYAIPRRDVKPVAKELLRKFATLKKVIDDKYSYKRPVSTIISYSAEPNELANDIGLKNPKMSPYAYYLVKYLDDEEIPITEVFRRVRNDMSEETKDKQRNSEINLLKDNIWLQPAKAMPSPSTTISMSSFFRLSNKSRTNPPTT